MIIILLKILISALLLSSLFSWLFVVKIGGKSRVIGFLAAWAICGVAGLLFLSNAHQFDVLFLFITALIALILVNKLVLKNINELLAMLGTILEAKKVSNTLSRLSLIGLLLRLKFKSFCTYKNNQPGKFSFNGYVIHYPDFAHLRALIFEIFINREYLAIGLGEKPYIIDCGANIGMTTLFLKTMYPSASVLCFEPDPASFSSLKKNIESNKLQNVSAEQKALALESGNISLSSGRHTETSSVFFNQDENVLTVAAVRLSDYIATSVDLLKIDVEGAETQIIEDLYTAKKLQLIKNIIMEYHYSLSNQNNMAQSLMFLEKSDFSYEIRCQANPLVPYKPHTSGNQDKQKLHTLTIFACNKRLDI